MFSFIDEDFLKDYEKRELNNILFVNYRLVLFEEFDDLLEYEKNGCNF